MFHVQTMMRGNPIVFHFFMILSGIRWLCIFCIFVQILTISCILFLFGHIEVSIDNLREIICELFSVDLDLMLVGRVGPKRRLNEIMHLADASSWIYRLNYFLVRLTHFVFPFFVWEIKAIKYKIKLRINNLKCFCGLFTIKS